MIRLVHFSDPHLFKYAFSWSGLFDKRLLGTLNYAVRRRFQIDEAAVGQLRDALVLLRPDIVVCTGDLTCTGSPAEFALAREALAPMAASPDYELLVLPGNHDAYVDDPACRRALAAALRELNRGRFELEDLPLERRYGGLRLFLLDASRPTPLHLSSGRLSDLSRFWLESRLKANHELKEKRISVCHFPTARADGRREGWRHRLSNGQWLRQLLLDQRLDLALCGHIHRPFVRREAAGTLEVCAGAVTIHRRLNIVDYDEASGELRQSWFQIGAPAAGAGLLETLIQRATPAERLAYNGAQGTASLPPAPGT